MANQLTLLSQTQGLALASTLAAAPYAGMADDAAILAALNSTPGVATVNVTFLTLASRLGASAAGLIQLQLTQAAAAMQASEPGVAQALTNTVALLLTVGINLADPQTLGLINQLAATPGPIADNEDALLAMVPTVAQKLTLTFIDGELTSRDLVQADVNYARALATNQATRQAAFDVANTQLTNANADSLSIYTTAIGG